MIERRTTRDETSRLGIGCLAIVVMIVALPVGAAGVVIWRSGGELEQLVGIAAMVVAAILLGGGGLLLSRSAG